MAADIVRRYNVSSSLLRPLDEDVVNDDRVAVQTGVETRVSSFAMHEEGCTQRSKCREKTRRLQYGTRKRKKRFQRLYV